jgi:AAA ATPase domain
MSKKHSPSFRFEKGKLLSQKQRIELWSGSVDGQPQFIKRFLFRRPELRREFLLQTKIVNPMFLRPLRAGFSEKGLFSYAMAANFPVSGLSADANDRCFLIEFLALIFALQRKGMAVRWDPSHFVYNSDEQRSFLAGFNRLCSESCVGMHEKNRRLLFQLRKYANDMPNGSASARILKKWERRKKGQLEGCLRELLSHSAFDMDRIVTLLEWSWSKELELIRGFYQLAERGKGRSILFLCDPGEGKSTLIRQIHEEFVVRSVTVTHKMNQDEKRPYHAIRKLFEQFHEDMRSYKGLKDIQRKLLQLIHDSSERNQETTVESFLKIIASLKSQHLPVLFLIDDADRYDAESVNILAEILRRVESLPVLFVMSSKTEIRAFDESIVRIPIQPAPLSRFLRSYTIPLWKSDQKIAFMEKIYDKTSGNPFFFHLYLMETLRGIGSTGIVWKDDRWMLTRRGVPDVLSESRALCIQGLPNLSPDEQAFLETASVQGTEFDPSLIPLEESLRMDLLKTLQRKEVVSAQNGRVRFRKAIVADSFYCGIPSQKLRSLHLSLAADLQETANPETYVSISRHLLRAGEIGSSLEFACRAFQKGGRISLLVLPVLEEMEKHVPQMDPSSRFRLYKYRG